MGKENHRGFENMDPELRRMYAKQGAKKVQELGKAHRYTHDEAVEAGKKSGRARRSGFTKGSWVEQLIQKDTVASVIADLKGK